MWNSIINSLIFSAWIAVFWISCFIAAVAAFWIVYFVSRGLDRKNRSPSKASSVGGLGAAMVPWEAALDQRRIRVGLNATHGGVLRAWFQRGLRQSPPVLRCPDCLETIWVEGPQGGMSTNMYCANEQCEAGFNLGVIGGEVLVAERIVPSKLTPDEWQRIRDIS